MYQGSKMSLFQNHHTTRGNHGCCQWTPWWMDYQIKHSSVMCHSVIMDDTWAALFHLNPSAKWLLLIGGPSMQSILLTPLACVLVDLMHCQSISMLSDDLSSPTKHTSQFIYGMTRGVGDFHLQGGSWSWYSENNTMAGRHVSDGVCRDSMH